MDEWSSYYQWKRFSDELDEILETKIPNDPVALRFAINALAAKTYLV